MLSFATASLRARAKQSADIQDTRIVQFPGGIRRDCLDHPVLERGTEYERVPGAGLISTRSWERLYAPYTHGDFARIIRSTLRYAFITGERIGGGNVREFFFLVDVHDWAG